MEAFGLTASGPEMKATRGIAPERLLRVEKPGRSIDDLNSAAPAVFFVPIHVEDSGPEVHGSGKLQGQFLV